MNSKERDKLVKDLTELYNELDEMVFGMWPVMYRVKVAVVPVGDGDTTAKKEEGKAKTDEEKSIRKAKHSSRECWTEEGEDDGVSDVGYNPEPEEKGDEEEDLRDTIFRDVDEEVSAGDVIAAARAIADSFNALGGDRKTALKDGVTVLYNWLKGRGK